MTKRPKPDTPTAIKLLGPARTTRERMGGDDFSPMVVFAPRRGQAMMAVLDGEGYLHDLVAEILTDMRERLGPPLWIAVTTDAFVKATNQPEAYAPGALAQQFAAGDPEITEHMVVILRRRNKPVEVASQVYRYSMQDGFEWDPPELVTDYRAPITDVLDRYII